VDSADGVTAGSEVAGVDISVGSGVAVRPGQGKTGKNEWVAVADGGTSVGVAGVVGVSVLVEVGVKVEVGVGVGVEVGVSVVVGVDVGVG